MLTAFYELTQIIINSDIILVKHYFNNEQAGLYASLALIGEWFILLLDVCDAFVPKSKLKKDRKHNQF
jgi:hypothetical protein